MIVDQLAMLFSIILLLSVVTTGAFAVLSQGQIAAYDRDGYLVAHGLLDVTDLASAVTAAEESSPKRPGYFSSVQSGPMFGESSKAFRDAALYSQLPTAVAELMKLDGKQETIRVLRDLAMVKDVQEKKTCGWHVDDVGFWPVSYLNESGINVWIALDDMPFAGNMAVAPGSHRADWRHDAYAALGQDRSQDGGQSREEIRQAMLENTDGLYATCDMCVIDPDLFESIEETAVHLNIKKGDVIFASRLLFHRTTDVTAEGLEHYAQQKTHSLKRYSIRYEPGKAKIIAGWNVEWSVLHDSTNTGKSLDEISDRYPEYAFYPRVWPTATDASSIDSVVEHAPAWTAQANQQVYETLFGGVNMSEKVTT